MKKLLPVVAIALVFITNSYSQPAGLGLSGVSKFTFDVTGGYCMAVSDFRGAFPDTLGQYNTIDFAYQDSYLVRKGFNFGLSGSMVVDSGGNNLITAAFSYSTFTQSADFPRPGGLEISYSNKINIVTFAAGLQYSILPKKKFCPFVGLQLAANLFSGNVSASGDTSYQQNRASETRYGVTADGGVKIKLNSSMGLLVGVKYSLANLFGKTYTAQTTSSSAHKDAQSPGSYLSNLSDIPLNDGTNGLGQSKSINYLLFYAGVTFYFGKIH